MRLAELMLRGQVYAALDHLDAGDESAFRAACAEVVTVHRLGPLLEHLHLLEQAKLVEAERACRIPELVELIRSTYPVEAAA